MEPLKRHTRRVLLEGLGWLLVLAGIAAVILPGPGLLMIFAGMALLATQYDWAERRLEPVRKAALKGAADSVESWPRIIISCLFAVGIIGAGIIWGLHPPAPGWWPLANKWWLAGGWGTGTTLILSGLIALAMIAYSYLNLRTKVSKH